MQSTKGHLCQCQRLDSDATPMVYAMLCSAEPPYPGSSLGTVLAAMEELGDQRRGKARGKTQTHRKGERASTFVSTGLFSGKRDEQ